MRQKGDRHQEDAECTIKDIRRQRRRCYSAEEEITIVVAGLRGEESSAVVYRHEGIAQSQYFSWSKEFLEAGKKWLTGNTAREANACDVKDLRRATRELKKVVAEQAPEIRPLKKGMTGDGREDE